MRSYPDRPWVAVGAIVFKGNKILMIKRAKAPNLGMWSLPGGAQSLGETVFDAAIREVFEETKVQATLPFFVDVIDSIHKDYNDKTEYHYTIIEVAMNWLSGEPQASDDVTDAKWMTIPELETHDLPNHTLDVIRKAVDQRSRKASFTEE